MRELLIGGLPGSRASSMRSSRELVGTRVREYPSTQTRYRPARTRKLSGYEVAVFSSTIIPVDSSQP
jgi:hypothetical protein